MQVRRRRAGFGPVSLPPWTIILIYVLRSFTLVFTLPRLEFRFLSNDAAGLSTGSALTIFGGIASGRLSLTASVFSLSFVKVQSSSATNSPRLVQWMARDPLMTH